MFWQPYNLDRAISFFEELNKSFCNFYLICFSFLLECECSEKGVLESNGEKDMTCSEDNGNCRCKDNFKGDDKCSTCTNGYFGAECQGE